MAKLGKLLENVSAIMPASSGPTWKIPDEPVGCGECFDGWAWRRDRTTGEPIPFACQCSAGDGYRGLRWQEVAARRRLREVARRECWRQVADADLARDFDGQIEAEVAAAVAGGAGLLIYGLAGRGKTYLAFAALREAARLARLTEAVSVPAWLREIRRSYGQNHPEEDAESIASAPDVWPALLLDDLGAERLTDWAAERVYLLIEARYQASGSRLTIVTSNYAPAEIEARFADRMQGTRIVSRLLGMCRPLELGGSDRRIPRRG